MASRKNTGKSRSVAKSQESEPKVLTPLEFEIESTESLELVTRSRTSRWTPLVEELEGMEAGDSCVVQIPAGSKPENFRQRLTQMIFHNFTVTNRCPGYRFVVRAVKGRDAFAILCEEGEPKRKLRAKAS